jgi:ketosteroid isomerase-like protein
MPMDFQKLQIEELFSKMISSFDKGPESLISFYSEDASIQLPFSKRNSAVMSRKQYFDHLSLILPMMKSFQVHDHKLYAIDEPGNYWATADLECIIKPTGKIYRQNYILRFCVNQENKITRYYEYGNPLKLAEAMKPLWKLLLGVVRLKISEK